MVKQNQLSARRRIAGRLTNWMFKLAPDIKGKSSVIGAFDAKLGGYAGDATDRHALIDGKYWMRLDLRGSIERTLYYRAIYEPAVVQQFGDLLKDARVVFDVGAHVGYYSLIAARAVGEAGRVHAFEADATICDYLRTNVEINDFKNVTVNNVAVSLESRSISFFPSKRFHAGTGSLIQNAQSDSESAEVRAISLDDYVRENRVDRLDALKIDVEGAEMDVLSGAVETLRQLRPKVICEVGPPDGADPDLVAYALGRVRDFAASNDYSCNVIEYYRELPYVLLTPGS